MSWVVLCLITTCIHEYVSAKILQFYVLIRSYLYVLMQLNKTDKFRRKKIEIIMSTYVVEL